MASSVQLDLFLDSRAVTLANEVIDALSARDATRATVLLNQLHHEAPSTTSLSSLETLRDALVHWRKPAADLAAIIRAMQELDEQVAPAAEGALGPRAHAFIGGFVRGLADVAQGLAYDPAHPRVYRASLCLRCGDWKEAEQAAQAIPCSDQNPDALRWLSVARYRMNGLAAARPTLFELAWREPQRLAAVIRELGDELLDRDWRAFGQASEWAGVEEGELPAWFPAWCLLEHPVIGRELHQVEFPDSPPAKAARLLLRLVELERQGNWRRLTLQRQQLRLLSVDLFSLYMARRAVRLL